MNTRLKSGLVVKAFIKLADKNFLPISVIKKGDYDRGIILLRIVDKEDMSVFYWSKFDLDNKFRWQIAGKEKYIDLKEGDKFVDQEINIDSDLWVLEIEDYSQTIEVKKFLI